MSWVHNSSFRPIFGWNYESTRELREFSNSFILAREAPKVSLFWFHSRTLDFFVENRKWSRLEDASFWSAKSRMSPTVIWTRSRNLSVIFLSRGRSNTVLHSKPHCQERFLLRWKGSLEFLLRVTCGRVRPALQERWTDRRRINVIAYRIIEKVASFYTKPKHIFLHLLDAPLYGDLR